MEVGWEQGEERVAEGSRFRQPHMSLVAETGEAGATEKEEEEREA